MNDQTTGRVTGGAHGVQRSPTSRTPAGPAVRTRLVFIFISEHGTDRVRLSAIRFKSCTTAATDTSRVLS